MNKNKKTGAILAIVVLIFVVFFGFYYKKSNLPAPSEQVNDQQNESPVLEESTTTSPVVTQPIVTKPKPIRVISPNGGETWEKRKQYLVKWDTTLPKETKAMSVLIKTSSVISDPYLLSPTKFKSYEMFLPSQFPNGLPGEGSITYVVPETIPPGTYQMLVWAGSNCTFSRPIKRCEFDMSDKLFTIK
ncbi:MAG: hypothetical protein AAB372_01330 [Patescibacteria group bacterium]